jgi:hypothetical protein
MKKLLMTLGLLAIFTSQGLALDITGSYVIADPFESENGTTVLCFYAFNGSADFEWVTDVIITLPACMVIVDPPAATAEPEDGTDFNSNALVAFTGYGTSVAHWQGIDDFGYGFLTGMAGGYFCVGVEIDCDCDNVYTIHWDLAGDGWGGAPHDQAGELSFAVLCSTPVEDSSLSDIKSLY